MRHFFLTKQWKYRTNLSLRNTRFIDFLNVNRQFIPLENATIEQIKMGGDSPYQYKMTHTFLSLKSIILAHENTRVTSTGGKSATYEQRISKKIIPHRYEFFLLNSMYLVGNVALKKDEINAERSFIAITDYQLFSCRPDNPEKTGFNNLKDQEPFSAFDYFILNTAWIQHYRRLMPHETVLWQETAAHSPS
jgi:hypothetical protein